MPRANLRSDGEPSIGITRDVRVVAVHVSFECAHDRTIDRITLGFTDALRNELREVEERLVDAGLLDHHAFERFELLKDQGARIAVSLERHLTRCANITWLVSRVATLQLSSPSLVHELAPGRSSVADVT